LPITEEFLQTWAEFTIIVIIVSGFGYGAVYPPSMMMSWPVVNAAPGELSHSTALAISSTVPIRPTGLLCYNENPQQDQSTSSPLGKRHCHYGNQRRFLPDNRPGHLPKILGQFFLCPTGGVRAVFDLCSWNEL
jgi:hypothetical protein